MTVSALEFNFRVNHSIYFTPIATVLMTMKIWPFVIAGFVD